MNYLIDTVTSFALNNWMISPIVLSLDWASTQFYLVIHFGFNWFFKWSATTSGSLESSSFVTVFDTEDWGSRHVRWLSTWSSDGCTDCWCVRDGWEKWINCLEATWKWFNIISHISSNGSCNYCLNWISLNGLITFLPLNPWQSICFHITFPRFVMDMKIVVSKTSNLPMLHCIQLAVVRTYVKELLSV